MNEPLPRTIWMFWAQGWDQAPWLVQRCVQSWRLHNPNWRLVQLDASSMLQYAGNIDVGVKLSLAHQSDLLRLKLLGSYGGIWADATTLCRQPLDGWIDEYCSSGFFAFHRPGRDRLLANWFLASQPGCVLMVRLHQILFNFWQQHRFHGLNDRRRWLVALLSSVLNQSCYTTRFWFSPLVSRYLRIYPYFVFHYAFERLVASDIECKSIWYSTPRLSAIPPRLVERLGFHALATPALLDIVRQCSAPLYKLSWQYECESGFESTLLHQILIQASPPEPQG